MSILLILSLVFQVVGLFWVDRIARKNGENNPVELLVLSMFENLRETWIPALIFLSGLVMMLIELFLVE